MALTEARPPALRRRSRGDKTGATGRDDWSAWPNYDAAALGFRN